MLRRGFAMDAVRRYGFCEGAFMSIPFNIIGSAVSLPEVLSMLDSMGPPNSIHMIIVTLFHLFIASVLSSSFWLCLVLFVLTVLMA